MSEQPLLPFAYLPQTGSNAKFPRFSEILALVCARFGITEEEIKSEGLARRLSRPRQVLMYLGVVDTNNSTVWVGKRIGNRDHSTVIHGRDKVAKLMKEGDQEIILAIEAIRGGYEIQELA